MPRPRARLVALLGLTVGVAAASLAPARAARGGPADPDDRVRLSLPNAGLPFSPGDLEAAVEARLAVARDGGPATEVTVTPTPTPGTVVVMSARRLEEVAVAGKSPVEAARLVALAIVAVVRPAISVDRGLVAQEGGDAVENSLELRAGRAGAAAPSRFTVAAATGLSLGLREGSASSESLIEAAWSWGAAVGDGGSALRPWQIAVGLGFARASADGVAFALDSYPLRLGLRRRWRFLVAGAGPVVRRFHTRGLDDKSGGVAGGFGSLAADVALGAGFRATATISCDVHSERLVFRTAGKTVLTTAPVIPWLGIGLSWGAS
jgi:hypothetical protein